MELVKVRLKKNDKVIEVLPDEVEGLRQAGVLKEDKQLAETKENKEAAETKEKKVVIKSHSKNWYPGPGETEEPAPLPVNIGKHSINKGKR